MVLPSALRSNVYIHLSWGNGTFPSPGPEGRNYRFSAQNLHLMKEQNLHLMKELLDKSRDPVTIIR